MKTSQLITLLHDEIIKSGDTEILVLFDDYVLDISNVITTKNNYDIEDGHIAIFAN